MQQGEFGFRTGWQREAFASGAFHLRGFAMAGVEALMSAIASIVERAPFRHMVTPGGQCMSAAMTNCGALGWVSDRRGYRYEANDPLSGEPWPAMPAAFRSLCADAAAAGGYPAFVPDACLINRYEPGAGMGVHRDGDERDFTQPIVSVSLGLPVTFRFGGLQREGATTKLTLEHGDVLVWGGPSRLCYHAVSPLKDGDHEVVGRCRINLTFRRAG